MGIVERFVAERSATQMNPRFVHAVRVCFFAAVVLAGCQQKSAEPASKSLVTSKADSFQTKLFDFAVKEGTTSFAALVDKYPNESFYAFTFYTNNDLRGVYPFANTVEGLDRSGYDVDSEETWIAGEWNLAVDHTEIQMAETNRLLLEASDAFADDALDASVYGTQSEFRQETFSTLSRALLAIRDSDVFRNHAASDRIAFWVHVGDPDGDDQKLMFRFVLEHLKASDVEQLREIYEID